jgi:predicted adenylyl cyclase CyaB
VLNVELKARCDDLERVRELCRQLGAEVQEPDRQTDTYFRVPHGRLKLRESLRTGPALIQYVRADLAAARESHYDICPVEDAEALKRILRNALGILAVVVKRREVLTIGDIRVHLDKVQGLGTFVELEGLLGHPGELPLVAGQIMGLQRALAIDARSLVRESYADLMSAAGRAGDAGRPGPPGPPGADADLA